MLQEELQDELQDELQEELQDELQDELQACINIAMLQFSLQHMRGTKTFHADIPC